MSLQAALVVGVVALAACGATAHPTQTAATGPSTAVPSSTTPAAGYAALYSNAVAPADTAITRFNAQASALPNSATVTDVARIAAPVANTLAGVDQRLLAITWPPKLTTDVRAEVRADTVVIADLRGVSTQTARSLPTLKKQFTSDLSALAVKVSIVVNELASAK